MSNPLYVTQLEQRLAEAKARIELLEHDAKTGDYETLYAQTLYDLEASHAREEQLREALVEVGVFLERVTHWQEGLYDLHGAKMEVKTSLALPTDDSALKARLKAERERCATEAELADSLVHRVTGVPLAALIECAKVLRAYDGSHAIDQWDSTMPPSRQWDTSRAAAVAPLKDLKA